MIINTKKALLLIVFFLLFSFVQGNLFKVFAVTGNTGTIITVAGNGTRGLSGDGGEAISAELFAPLGLAVDNSGNIYFANYKKIRKIDTNGVISTVAGNGTLGYSGDGGLATSAQLRNPQGVAVDDTGNIYIADTENSCIRKIDTSGVISTVAGNGTWGYSGDGGAATSAQLNNPWGVT